MKAYRTRRRFGRRMPGAAILLIPLGVAIAAAASQPPASSPHNPADFAHLQPAPASSGPRSPSGPVAYIAGAPVTLEDLRPTLAEIAGGQALQEVTLDRLLARELASRNLTVTREDLAAEQNVLIASISRSAKATPQDADRLLEQVRRSRGLGDARFSAMLRRTASMRKLVAEDVTVADEEIKQAFDMSHGPKYRARLILVSTQQSAAEVRARLLGLASPTAAPSVDTPPPSAPAAMPSDLLMRFAEEAFGTSTDPSGARGGLLEPISPADPAYPSAVREALATLVPGTLSNIIPVDKGFALLLLQSQIPPDGTKLEDLKPQIRAELQKRHERIAMDDLARRLLKASPPTILDADLNWSWRNAQPSSTN